MKKQSFYPLIVSLSYLLRWTAFSLAAGIIGGLIGGAFSHAIRLATDWGRQQPWLLYCLPLIGLLIVFLYHRSGELNNRGTNMILSAVSETDQVTSLTGPLIFTSTVLSHLGGASVGREGAALQLGGWLGARMGELLKLDEKDKRTAIMCGMAALFAALFGTPVAAAIFCIEVFSVGVFFYSALIPCVFSAFIGAAVAGLLGTAPELYVLGEIPPLSIPTLGLTMLLGLLCAFLAIGMILFFHGSQHMARRWIPNPYLRSFTAGLIIVGLTLLLGSRDYSGAGSGLIEKALLGESTAPQFALKMLLTGLALAGGFKGGEIVPTLSIGACFGALFASLTGFPLSLGAGCGMIALFAGATNCPMAALLIAMEMFQGNGLPYFAIAVAMSFTMSGYYSLYDTQRFAFSKIKHGEKEISDVHTKK